MGQHVGQETPRFYISYLFTGVPYTWNAIINELEIIYTFKHFDGQFSTRQTGLSIDPLNFGSSQEEVDYGMPRWPNYDPLPGFLPGLTEMIGTFQANQRIDRVSFSMPAYDNLCKVEYRNHRRVYSLSRTLGPEPTLAGGYAQIIVDKKINLATMGNSTEVRARPMGIAYADKFLMKFTITYVWERSPLGGVGVLTVQ